MIILSKVILLLSKSPNIIGSSSPLTSNVPSTLAFSPIINLLQLTFTLPVTVPFIVTVSALTNKSSASPLKFTSPLATYIPFAFVPSFISTLAAAAFIFLSTFELINIVAPATLILPPTLSVSIVMLFPAARISASTFPATLDYFLLHIRQIVHLMFH